MSWEQLKKDLKDPRKRRHFKIIILTTMFNICSIGLYIESPNEFLDHWGSIDHRLSEFEKDNALQIALFFAILLFNAALYYSNHKTYYALIDKELPKPSDPFNEFTPLHPQEDPEEERKKNKKERAIAIVSSTFKAVVSSTSLAALLKNPIGSTGAIAASVVCLPGNFFSQFAIFIEPIVKQSNCHLNYRTRRILSHFLAFSYNLPNTALYFNAGDAFLEHIKMLDHRLSAGTEAWQYTLLTLLVFSSFLLFTSTQRSYSKKISDIFKDHGNNISENSSRCCNAMANKLTPFFAFESYWTAAFKTVITCITLVGTLYEIGIPLWLGFLVTGICVPGNLYANFVNFKPEKSQIEIENDFLEPKEDEPYCFGLFKRAKVKDAIGLSGPSSNNMDFSSS